MAGRPRKPTALKLLGGIKKKSRLNPYEPKPEIAMPEAPRHLSKIARAEWDRITVHLYRLGLLSEIDMAALAAYCQVYGRWVKAEEAINRLASGDNELAGYLTKTTNGNIIQSPLLGVANTALVLMHKYLVEFGFTPAARSKVTTTNTKQSKNGWELVG